MEITTDENNQIKHTTSDTILCKVETDYTFLNDIREIAEKKKASEDQQFFEEKKQHISDAELDQIHEKAQIHAQANIVNENNIINTQYSKMNIDAVDDNLKQFCFCGCKKQIGPLLPLMTNQQKIASLGPGVILLFFYLRQLRQLVFISFAIFGIFSVIANYTVGSQQQIDICSNYQDISLLYCNVSTASSFYSIKNNQTFVIFTSITGFFMIVVWIFGIRVIKRLGMKKDQQIDNLLDTSSDYAVKIDNLPYGNYTQIQLIEYLKYIWSRNVENAPKGSVMSKQKQFRIKSIQIIYNMQSCRRLIEDLKKLSITMIQCMERSEYKFTNIIIQNRILHYRWAKGQFLQKLSKLEDMRAQFLTNPEVRKTYATTCAIVEFQSQQDKTLFLNAMGELKNPIQSVLLPNQHIQFKNQTLTFMRSPQPSDILWLNCQKKFNYCKWAIIWAITILLLYLGYTIVSVVQTLAIFKTTDHVVVTIILQLLNRGIWFWLTVVIAFEENNTKTQAIISSMKKSVIAQTINIIVNPIISKFVNNKALYGSTGLSGMALTYQFVMFGMMMIYYIWNPFYLGKKLILKIKCFRKLIIRYLCRIVGKIDTTEEIRPVLTFYEGPDLPVAGAYVYMSTAIFHAMFYCHLQPLILLIATLNITLFFIIMKYMLYHRCKILELTNNNIFESAMFIANCAAAYYSVGSIFFYIIDDLHQFNIIAIIPSILCLLIWFISNLDICSIFTKVTNAIIKIMEEYSTPVKKQPQLDRHAKFKRKTQIVESLKIQEVQSEICEDNHRNSSDKLKNQGLFRGNLLCSNFTDNADLFPWNRRQSYFTDSNTNSLLEFQSILKEMKDYQLYNRGKSLKKFCEQFGGSYPLESKSQKSQCKSEGLEAVFKDRIIIKKKNKDPLQKSAEQENSIKYTFIPIQGQNKYTETQMVE